MEADRLARLTDKQRECLRLVYAHLSSKEIAQRLGVEPGTVDQYVKAAMRILGVSDRRAAARMLADYEGGEALRPAALALQEEQTPFDADPPRREPLLPLPLEGLRPTHVGMGEAPGVDRRDRDRDRAGLPGADGGDGSGNETRSELSGMRDLSGILHYPARRLASSEYYRLRSAFDQPAGSMPFFGVAHRNDLARRSWQYSLCSRAAAIPDTTEAFESSKPAFW